MKLSLDFFYAESAGVLINYSACFQICGLLLCNGETARLAPVRGTGVFSRPPELLTEIATATAIEKELMSALESVPEAFHYTRPSSLVRGDTARFRRSQQATEASHQSKYALVPCEAPHQL